ncbi:MAG TPA: ABC transporter substrate-binding protein [Dehalococcoidales bacterium]|nr:ABC transporter substrate-binding protein [Dehalococcoidales bacterium]
MQKKVPRIVLCLLLVTVMLVLAVGCGKTTTSNPTSATTSATTSSLTTTTSITNTSVTTTAATTTVATTTAATTYKFDRTFTLNVVTPLSGAASDSGFLHLRGAQMATDDMNAQGGLVVDGVRYKVVVASYDHASNVVTASQIIHQLVEGNNAKIVSVQGTGANMAIEDYLAQNNILNLGQISSLPATISPKWPLQFTMYPLSGVYTIKDFIPYYIDVMGAKSAMWITADSDMGRMFVNTEMQVIKANNYSLTFFPNQFYTSGTQDFSPVVDKVLLQKPDIILNDGALNGDIYLLYKQLREKGWNGIFALLTGQLSADDIWSVAAQYSVGAMTIGYSGLTETPNDRWVQFENRYQAKYNQTMNQQTPGVYDGTMQLFRAINMANSFDPYKIAYVMQDLTWNGLYGPASFGGDEPGSPFGIKRVPLIPLPLIQFTGKGTSKVLAMPSDGSNGKFYRVTDTIKQ